MKSTFISLAAALAVNRVAGHALFQQLWVDGVDQASSCIRMPMSNTPVTNVASKDFACNAGTKPVSGKCAAKLGGTVTVEMHQQPGDRSCGSEAIGGAHYGPVSVYLAKVPDSSTADGSSASWFKIFQDSWTKKAGAGAGDDDYWGTKDLNACCGKMDAKIPSDLEPGDYLLRAEALALHTAGSSGGAQFYMSCYQITLGGGSNASVGHDAYASPATVKIPGAVKASDPGVLINIHAAVSNYVAPGPPVYAGGSTKVAGSGCVNCEKSCKAGAAAPAGGAKPTTTPKATKPEAPTAAAANTPESSAGADTSAGCSVAAYGQCGGNGYTGCTTCPSGYTCKAISPPYFSQCVAGS